MGTGTGASCTEAALTACLPGGASFTGTVTFNCGGAVPITVTSTKTISADTTIDGGSLVTITGGHSGVGVFSVSRDIAFTIQNLTIADSGGAIYKPFGGALQVTKSTFSDNSASWGNIFNGGGGAIYNAEGTVTVTDSTFSGNRASAGGGAIFNNSGTMTVTNSTFSGNSASGGGGAIDNAGGAVTVTNSTFSANNAASGGGAIYTSGGGTVTVTNSIVANSVSGGNCAGSVTDGGHNIDDGGTCAFAGAGCATTSGNSLCYMNPGLDPTGLQNNDGPTQTIALCTDTDAPSAGCTGVSPAINAGDESVCSMTTGPAPVNSRDQRGYVRPGAGADHCSIGAFEANLATPMTTPSATPTTAHTVMPTPTATPTSPLARTPTVTAAGTVSPPATGSPLAAATATPTPITTPDPCVGACTVAGLVSIDDIIKLVNVALGSADSSTCLHGNPGGGPVTIDVIVTAVNNALSGCA